MSAEAKAVFGQVVFDDPKGFGAHAVEFGQFRAWDARELTQGCVARVVQGAGRRCADLGKLIERCRHAERLGPRFRTQPGPPSRVRSSSWLRSPEGPWVSASYRSIGRNGHAEVSRRIEMWHPPHGGLGRLGHTDAQAPGQVIGTGQCAPGRGR